MFINCKSNQEAAIRARAISGTALLMLPYAFHIAVVHMQWGNWKLAEIYKLKVEAMHCSNMKYDTSALHR